MAPDEPVRCHRMPAESQHGGELDSQRCESANVFEPWQEDCASQNKSTRQHLCHRVSNPPTARCQRVYSASLTGERPRLMASTYRFALRLSLTPEDKMPARSGSCACSRGSRKPLRLAD